MSTYYDRSWKLKLEVSYSNKGNQISVSTNMQWLFENKHRIKEHANLGI